MTIDLEAIEKLVDATTPGPWGRWIVTTPPQEMPNGDRVPLMHAAAPPHKLYDDAEATNSCVHAEMEFIAAARTWVPLAIAEIRRLQATQDSLPTWTVPEGVHMESVAERDRLTAELRRIQSLQEDLAKCQRARLELKAELDACQAERDKYRELLEDVIMYGNGDNYSGVVQRIIKVLAKSGDGG